jgi:hypothetical protein
LKLNQPEILKHHGSNFCKAFNLSFIFQKFGSGGSFGSYKIKEPPKTLLTTNSLREELAMIKPLETRNRTTLVTTSVGWLSVMEPDNQKSSGQFSNIYDQSKLPKNPITSPDRSNHGSQKYENQF